MKVHEVMTRDVQSVKPDSPLAEAARLMRDLNVGSLPVQDGREVRGMITDRDIVIRAVAEGRDCASTRVSEAMTRQVCWCREDQDVEEAAEVMERHQVRRLPVLNESRDLVGIVALGDLAVGMQDERLAGEVLERVSEPAQPRMVEGSPHPPM